ncbi:aspartyl/asparaginyl beta-hydroxylase domain-containing protein [Microbulbifer sp. ANSA003]|uniref:aspartyl/asparaginyl beta-hydroxylase domain-containing protein n=1 Tax=Microbulbifer sp. ANSA003 TaxID=3243360 RepID=UPI004041D020
MERIIESIKQAYFNIIHKLLLRSTSLSGQAYWDSRELPWLAELEKNHQVFAQELAEFKRKQEKKVDKEDLFPGLTDNFGTQPWEFLHLMVYGEKIEAVACHFPRTFALVEQLVPKHVSIIVSTIPGEREDIPEHEDEKNGTLRLHLGLDIPQDGENFISVSGEKRSWQQGKAFVADVTQPHWVRKTSTQARAIIMVDFVRPTSRLLEWLGYHQFVRIKGVRVSQLLNRQYRKLITAEVV